MKPDHLKTDWFSNPIGIGNMAPVLSWQVPTDGTLHSTSAWQILVSDSLEKLQANSGNLQSRAEASGEGGWDSGKVTKARETQAVYKGSSPTSRQRLWWKVKVWDEKDKASEWSEACFWEMGLLQRSDWKANWIGSSVVGGPQTPSPAPYLRKDFSVGKPIVAARLYVTALGLFECEMNGQRVGNDVFTPGWTDYNKQVVYHTYDVTHLMKSGNNTLGAILGDGWYCGYVGWFARQTYGDRPKLFAQLEITLKDGSRQVIATDSSWKTATGPILESDLLMGESYDARLEFGAWSSPGFNDAEWLNVRVFEKPSIEIRSASCLPVQRHEILPATLENSINNQYKIFNFGQNFSGRIRVSVKGSKGTHLILRHGERLDEKKLLYTANLRSAKATDHYTLKGEGVEVFEPRFTFHGFQYASLTWKGSLEIISVEGVVLHSGIPATGHFACSNPLLNQLSKNIWWGQKSNFLEVPTDCPQRDERLGWTGDAQVFARTACFYGDVRNFFHKWMRDIRDSQEENGSVNSVVPKIQSYLPKDGGPAWADATVICPWTIYLTYGDVRILEEHYESMQRYIDFLIKNTKDMIRSHPDTYNPTQFAGGGYGDWLALDNSKGNEGMTRKDLIGTAFLVYDLDLMEKISKVLGKSKEEENYRQWREKITKVFQQRFMTPDGLMAGSTQTSYVLALHFGLLPEASRSLAAAELVHDIKRRGKHLATGFVGTPYLCQVLENHGYLDIAYELLEQETFPSWLFPVKNGATTIWERWDGWTERGFQSVNMNSFNHYAYGAIGAWMVSTVAGLELDPQEPGYSHIIFRPRPGGKITWAEAKLETPKGQTSIRWELKENELHLELTVPVNARATLSLPSGFKMGKAKELTPGKHAIKATKAV